MTPKLTPVVEGIAALGNASPGHARLGPSGAKKWLSCPGSLVLESAFPNKSTRYSDDGTACHDVAARCLTQHIPRAAHFIGEYIEVQKEGEPRRTVLFDPDLAELTQTYVDAIRSRGFDVGTTLWVEQRVDTSEWLGVPDQFGTADAAMLTMYLGEDAAEDGLDVEMELHDAKFGRTPVDVNMSPQLLLYTLGFITSLMRQQPPTAVTPPTREQMKVFRRSLEIVKPVKRTQQPATLPPVEDPDVELY